MDEKESTVSGSPGDSETNSPPPVSSSVVVTPPLQQVLMNLNMNMAAENVSVERSNNNIPTTTPPSVASSIDLFGKKKRGRPRKYDSEGNLRVKPFNQQALVTSSSPPGFSLFSPSPPPTDGLVSFSKKGRGRPSGSGNWQLLASLGELFANTAGGDFTPHVVTVNTGEDVAGKILSFPQKGPRGICVLSANGAVSNVTIRQPGSSGGILTYEGRFEILSLSGSFTFAETGGIRSRTGGLSVSLASPDGRVIGGGIAGLLLAASPIQIVIGSFMPNCYKARKKKQRSEHMMDSAVSSAPHVVADAKPDSETCFISMTPLPKQQNHGAIDKSENDQPISNVTNFQNNAYWNGLEPTSNEGPSPDINVSVHSEEDAVQGTLFA